jgi:hypothetical protein
MLLTVNERETQRIARIKDQMREQERARFADPDEQTGLGRVWVAYVWAPSNKKDIAAGEWLCAGFRRGRRRRKPQTMNKFFAKVRRQLGLAKEAHVKLMDLQTAVLRSRKTDQSWRTVAPQFQERRAKMAQHMPAIDKTKRKRRATVRAYKLRKQDTYIAIARNAWDRASGYLYLGPLSAASRRDAEREARRTFPIYPSVTVIASSALSKHLRGRMRSGKKVIAGFTRVQWPEVPPTFDAMWAKLVRRYEADIRVWHHGVLTCPICGSSGNHGQQCRHYLGTDSARYEQVSGLWHDAGCPWLTIQWLKKQIESLAPSPSLGDAPCAAPKRKLARARRCAGIMPNRHAAPSTSRRSPKKAKHAHRATRKSSVRKLIGRIRKAIRSR